MIMPFHKSMGKGVYLKISPTPLCQRGANARAACFGVVIPSPGFKHTGAGCVEESAFDLVGRDALGAPVFDIDVIPAEAGIQTLV